MHRYDKKYVTITYQFLLCSQYCIKPYRLPLNNIIVIDLWQDHACDFLKKIIIMNDGAVQWNN